MPSASQIVAYVSALTLISLVLAILIFGAILRACRDTPVQQQHRGTRYIPIQQERMNQYAAIPTSQEQSETDEEKETNSDRHK